MRGRSATREDMAATLAAGVGVAITWEVGAGSPSRALRREESAETSCAAARSAPRTSPQPERPARSASHARPSGVGV